MANGIYTIGVAANQDCQVSSGAFSNSGNTACVGNWSGTICRWYGNFQMDIPAGATIDSADLYAISNATAGASAPVIYLQDYDNCAAYDSTPWANNLTATSATWSSPPATSAWGHVSITALVQAFVNRGGYALGNYMGLCGKQDGAANNVYFLFVQSQYNLGLAPFIVVAYHTATTKVVYVSVAASADDTYNLLADTGSNYTTASVIAGYDGNTASNYAFARFNIGVPASSTINAAYLVGETPSVNGNTGFNLYVNALTSTSAFSTSGSSYALGTIGSSSTTWAISGVSAAVCAIVSPSIASTIQAAVNAGGYGGTYLDLRLSGTTASKNFYRDFYSYDSGAGHFPLILVTSYVTNAPLTAIGATTGLTRVGSTLTAGALSPGGATATYQWQRCTTSGGTYSAIGGATSATYASASGDEPYFIKVVATGSGSYTGSVTSAPVGPISVRRERIQIL